MVSEKSTYMVNLISQAIGRVATTVVNFFVFVFVAREMGTEIFGQFSYILSFWAILCVLAEFGTQTILAKDIAQLSKDDAPAYFGNYLLFRSALGLLFAVLGAIVAYFARMDLFVFILGGCVLLPFLSWRFFDPIFQVYQRPWYAARTSLIFAVIYGCLMLAALYLSGSLKAVIAAYLVSNIIYTWVLKVYAWRLLKPRFRIDPKILKGIGALALPMGIASVYTIINSKADIFMLAYLKSDTVVGIYNAAYRFIDLIALTIATFTIPMIPLFARWFAKNKQALRHNYGRIMELTTAVSVPCALVVPFVSEPLIGTVFGPAYREGAAVLNILAWVAVLLFFSLISSIVNIVAEDLRHSYWNGALAATINITLNAIWIPVFGMIGSAWATLISEIALLSVCLFHVFRNIGNFMNVSAWSRIVGLNAALAAVLYLPAGKEHIGLKIVIGGMVYAWLLFRTEVISVRTIKSLMPHNLKKEMVVQ